MERKPFHPGPRDPRTERFPFHIKLTAEEREMLRRLTVKMRTTAANVIRALIAKASRR